MNDYAPGYLYDQSSDYAGSAGSRRPVVNGVPLTDDQWGSIPQYAEALADGGSPGRGGSGRLHQGADGNYYWSDGTRASGQDIDRYFQALADEDARRYGVDNRYRYDALHSQDAQRKAQIKQAKRQLAEEQRQYDLTRQDRNYQFGVNTGVDLLKTGAQMRGPLDYFQGDAFARGAGAISPWLQSLRTGGPVAYGGGTGSQGNPVPLTVSTLADAMSGGGTYNTSTGPSGPSAAPVTGAGGPAAGVSTTNAAPGGTDAYGRPTLSPAAQARLDSISQVAQKGLANLGLGSLENLTDDERKAFRSGLDYLGRSSNDEMQFYQRSRPGQGSALSG